MPNKNPSPLELAHLAARFVTDEKSVPGAVALAIRLWDASCFAVGHTLCDAYATGYKGPLAGWIERGKARESIAEMLPKVPKWKAEWDELTPKLFALQLRTLFPRIPAARREDRLLDVLTYLREGNREEARSELGRYRKPGIGKNAFGWIAMHVWEATRAARAEAGRKGGKTPKKKKP